MIDGIAAAQWLLNYGSVDPSKCLYYVWQAYKAQGASTSMGARTAFEAWGMSDGQRPGDRNPPAGAAVWWGRRTWDGNTDGDVVISLGGGMVAVTEPPHMGSITGSCTLDERENEISREYLGWTSSIFDCPINVNAGKDAAPAAPVIDLFKEDTMPAPIINVVDRNGAIPENGTVYIGRDDGEFEPLDKPYFQNERGIISKAFFSGDGSKDLIPTLSAADFEAVKVIWRQMRRGRVGDPGKA